MTLLNLVVLLLQVLTAILIVFIHSGTHAVFLLVVSRQRLLIVHILLLLGLTVFIVES